MHNPNRDPLESDALIPIEKRNDNKSYKPLFSDKAFDKWFKTTVGSVAFAPYGFSALNYKTTTDSLNQIPKWSGILGCVGISLFGIIYHNFVCYLDRDGEVLKLKQHFQTIEYIEHNLANGGSQIVEDGFSNDDLKQEYQQSLAEIQAFVTKHETAKGAAWRLTKTFLQTIDQTALIGGMWQVTFLLINAATQVFDETVFSYLLAGTTAIGLVSALCNATTTEFEVNVGRLINRFNVFKETEAYQAIKPQVASINFGE